MDARPFPRRRLLLGAAGATAATAAGAVLGGLGSPADATAPADAAVPAGGDPVWKQIPATENLMLEHGMLKRVLLAYREIGRRIGASEPVPVDAVASSAGIVRDYIEGFHEALEEGYVFPRLRSAGVEVATVDTLLVQHARGRQLTQAILAAGTGNALARPSARAALARNLAAFVRMYEPHEAREDTVIFPAYRSLLTARQLAEAAHVFSSEQDRLFGPKGFAKVVAQVAAVEKTLGIADLARFTPAGPA